MNKNKEDKNIERYKNEFENNEKSILKLYSKISIFIDKSVDDDSKIMREIYNTKIEENKSNIAILNTRNKELKEIIQSNQRSINDKIQLEKYIEKYK
ncbi:hypothetical protein GW891_01040 [bacterium]|nr:hypothetical protein [bacterium]